MQGPRHPKFVPNKSTGPVPGEGAEAECNHPWGHRRLGNICQLRGCQRAATRWAYFADVITFLHIFCAVKWRKKNRLGVPYYLLNPFTRVNYVAAEETMRGSWISRLFALAGALTVKRTWRSEGKEVRRGLDPSDTRKIERALDDNWVITFPQGTTKPFAPGRKGTALIIKRNKPIVVPVVISGFWRAFNKKGLKFKKKGSTLSVTFKEPLQIDYDAPAEDILNQVMDAIEQSKKHMMQGAHHWVNIDK